MQILKLAEQSDLVTATNPRMVPLEPEGQIVTFFGDLHRSWVGLIRTAHGSEATACLSVIPFRARIDFPVVVLVSGQKSK